MNTNSHPTKILGRHGCQSGQVEVETAIVLPMVVFLLLGLIQMGLLQQARLISEYAAYRAVRTGALKNANVSMMEQAARVAAMPIFSMGVVGNKYGGAPLTFKSSTATEWTIKYAAMEAGDLLSTGPFPGIRFAEIVICGPTQSLVEEGKYTVDGTDYVSFDHPKLANMMPGTKLRIELVINYRMIIPFADMVIYRMWKGQKVTSSLNLDSRGFVNPLGELGDMDTYALAAAAGIFIVPIKVHYAMKLHSDVRFDAFPEENPCGDEKL